MTIDKSYWENTEMKMDFGSKTWLLSDIYTSAYLNLTIMVGKHALATILRPHKYVLLVSQLGRKYAEVSKKDYIEDWETRQRISQISEIKSFEHDEYSKTARMDSEIDFDRSEMFFRSMESEEDCIY